MEKYNSDFDLEPLSDHEMRSINGGESLWYWIAYGVGATGRFAVLLWEQAQKMPFEFMNA